MKHISQRAARRALKELGTLREAERLRWASWSGTYPGGTHIQSIISSSMAPMSTASKLGYALVCKVSGGELLIYAVKREWS